MIYSKKNKAFHFGKSTKDMSPEEVDTLLTENRDLRLKGGAIGFGLLVLVIIILKLVMMFTDIK
ncbi:MAG: hypothetical protein HOE80_02920 [Candidatus Magasanikbacteria bacterium]|jgi:hypothetical protein|nr:hypothetical protein [Candidatus Magasanikbacteria bacterium]MBT4071651.1 hypothetical protein [Candidatus Magasanikbacteria bacterium]